MTEFTPVSALAGGALIGLASVLLFAGLPLLVLWRVRLEHQPWGRALAWRLATVMGSVAMLVGALLLVFWVSPQLALSVALVVAAMLVLVIFYGGRMTQTWRAIYARVGDFNVRLEEALGGVRVVQAFGNEAHENHLFAGDNAALLPVASLGIWLYFWGLPMEGLLLVGATYFQAINRARIASLLTGGKLVLIGGFLWG